MRKTVLHLMNSEDQTNDIQTTAHASTLLAFPLGWMQFQLCRGDPFTREIPMKGSSSPDLSPSFSCCLSPRGGERGLGSWCCLLRKSVHHCTLFILAPISRLSPTPWWSTSPRIQLKQRRKVSATPCFHLVHYQDSKTSPHYPSGSWN